MNKLLLSGNEAVALAAFDCGVNLGCGYPGTPSSEILDEFNKLGGSAEWEPNEKCALETAIGVALAGGRSIVTMKHVGLNVAADPFFTIAYSGTPGGLVVISADDPGMASSQNEQDNRRYAISAGVPMFEPSDSQEAYDFLIAAFELADKFRSPVLFRMTTRVCHSKCVVLRKKSAPDEKRSGHFEIDPKSNVMVPAFARLAHRRLRADLAAMREINEQNHYNIRIDRSSEVGIISSGVAYQHAREAAPEASFLKLGFTYPLPEKTICDFAKSVKKLWVIEEGDPVLKDAVKALGIKIEECEEEFRFGELNVKRVRKMLVHDATPEPPPPAPPKPPQLCPGCPHRKTFEVLRDLGCIVSGDIGCYTLGVMPPFGAIHSCVCMGASITVGIGLRKQLPENEARRVVSVIGDSTFFHTGVNGIVELVYNPPETGHVVIILDNRTTAMTGMQENPGTGRKLDHETPAKQLSPESIVKGIGVDFVEVVDSTAEPEKFRALVEECCRSNRTSVIVVRRQCVLAAVRSKKNQ